jgi:hypothetical protein
MPVIQLEVLANGGSPKKRHGIDTVNISTRLDLGTTTQVVNCAHTVSTTFVQAKLELYIRPNFFSPAPDARSFSCPETRSRATRDIVQAWDVICGSKYLWWYLPGHVQYALLQFYSTHDSLHSPRRRLRRSSVYYEKIFRERGDLAWL